MEAFRELFPHDEMLIFSDTKNCPYGDRSTEQIREFTFAGVKHLFEHEHCDVVILACNTAAAVSIRWLQREAMPGRHLLSITIPGIEALAA
jgi:glutamate racemase